MKVNSNNIKLLSNKIKYFIFKNNKVFLIKKIKIIIIIIIFYFYQNKFQLIFHKFKINHDRENKSDFLDLKDKSFFNNSSIIQEKERILSFFSKELEKNITFVNNLFYSLNFNFGNLLCSLNKIIFYCEILGCKKIFLDKDIFWFNNFII